MSHTVHPFSHRLGIIRDWRSRWFGGKESYKDFLKTDILIRGFLTKKLRGMFVGGVDIERSEKALKVIISTSRPGVIIGRNGEGSTKLKSDMLDMLSREGITLKEELRIDIKEIKNPEASAMIVAQMIADGLEKRMPFRRVAKQAIEKVMANRDVMGIKLVLSGRLGGADMSRKEKMKKGRIPLQTFRADIDFARYEANMSYGKIGIKIWIYRGEIFAKKVDQKKG